MTNYLSCQLMWMFWTDHIPSHKTNHIGNARAAMFRKYRSIPTTLLYMKYPVWGFPYSYLTNCVASEGIHFPFVILTSNTKYSMIWSTKDFSFCSILPDSPSRYIMTPKKTAASPPSTKSTPALIGRFAISSIYELFCDHKTISST